MYIHIHIYIHIYIYIYKVRRAARGAGAAEPDAELPRSGPRASAALRAALRAANGARAASGAGAAAGGCEAALRVETASLRAGGGGGPLSLAAARFPRLGLRRDAAARVAHSPDKVQLMAHAVLSHAISICIILCHVVSCSALIVL